jgi:outer membrane protein insertion porin family/translocation and assembly module TamA
VGRAFVLATRLRVGAVLGPTLRRAGEDAYVPAQERLYAGGASTVRGFRQNELGPVVYNVAGYDTVRADGTPGGNPADPAQVVYFRSNPAKVSQRAIPAGGNALIVANIEGRFRSPVFADLAELAVFTDVGRVWNYGSAARVDLRSIQATPGIGARIRTLVGLIRLDIGYNPYQRGAGASYYDSSINLQGVGGQLFCVSPGNTLRVTAVRNASTGATAMTQESGTCPSDFQPLRERNFVRRLAFQFSLGQAF